MYPILSVRHLFWFWVKRLTFTFDHIFHFMNCWCHVMWDQIWYSFLWMLLLLLQCESKSSFDVLHLWFINLVVQQILKISDLLLVRWNGLWNRCHGGIKSSCDTSHFRLDCLLDLSLQSFRIYWCCRHLRYHWMRLIKHLRWVLQSSYIDLHLSHLVFQWHYGA